MIISNSDRSTFKNCRRKWDLTSPNRQNWIPNKRARPLWLGTLVHNCLEYFYRGDFLNARDALDYELTLYSEDDLTEFADEVSMAEVMLTHYSLVYPSSTVEPFDSLLTEFGFRVPLDEEGAFFAGTIDGVVRDRRTGRIGILEHKTFSRHKDYELHAIDDQTSIYPAVLNKLIKEGLVPGVGREEFCDHVIYNGLWKKVPGEVKLLKNGSLAKRCFSNTTPHWVRHKLKGSENKVPFDIDNIPELGHNISRFFPRFYIFRGEREQNLAIERLIGEVAEMRRPDLVLYHNPTTECSWKCGFIPVCTSMNEGLDTESLLQAHYIKAPSRGAVYAESKEKEENE